MSDGTEGFFFGPDFVFVEVEVNRRVGSQDLESRHFFVGWCAVG